MRIVMMAAVLAVAPLVAFAAGSGDSNPPKTTQTSTECKAGQIWDKKSKSCLDAQESRFNDDARYDAVRELAYAGQLDRASSVLDTMGDQGDSRVLTYRGFIARKLGRMDIAMDYYHQALAADADNLLARSYMGQGMVQMGKPDQAAFQLAEIRARGGSGSWAEASLANAIKTGATFSY